MMNPGHLRHVCDASRVTLSHHDLLPAGHFPHVLKRLNPLLIRRAIHGIPRRPVD